MSASDDQPQTAADATCPVLAHRVEPDERSGYDNIFWLAYLSNGLTTLANGMLVRYADFVDVLGGDEQQLGLIVGCGMIGSILFRLAQGEAVDRHGASRVWLYSTCIYSVSLLAHLWLTTANGPGVFCARLLMQASLAGIFGSSITFVALRVRPERMAEIVGVLGTSGFIGLMIGPVISDWLGRHGNVNEQMVRSMFEVAFCLSVAAFVATWLATRGSIVPTRHHRPPILSVVAQYQPWLLSLTAAAMGAGFSIPMTFLRPFASETKLDGVALFFVVYALSGFIVRIASRSLFLRFGNRPCICVGLLLLTLSYVCFVPITRAWHLIIPASIAGTAHALLFPSVMSAGTSVFPRQYLGVATALMLTMFDVGTFIAAPMIGIFLHSAKHYTEHAYSWLFVGISIVLAVVTAAYYLNSAPPDADDDPREA